VLALRFLIVIDEFVLVLVNVIEKAVIVDPTDILQSKLVIDVFSQMNSLRFTGCLTDFDTVSSKIRVEELMVTSLLDTFSGLKL
jgi:hypothetical protein